MKRLKAAVVGMGFIGVAHVEALRRVPYVDVVAIADPFGRPSGWVFPPDSPIIRK